MPRSVGEFAHLHTLFSRLGASLGAPARELARDARDPPLELAYARLTSPSPHDRGHRSVLPRHGGRIDAVRTQLLRDEKPSRDGVLLVIEVARQANDLHPIAQRVGDVRQRVGGRHEEHRRQVVIDLEVVIVERAVLLGIEHFEQRSGGIAAPVLAELVDLVQQQHRVDHLGAAHGLHDPTGHGADVRASVTANLRFVTNAAERHADEPASERAGDRAAERGFSDARRPDETEDRPLERAHPPEHGDEIEDAILHLLETVMVLLQHNTRVRDVDGVIGALRPRQRHQPIEIVARDGRFGRERRRAPQLAQLAIGSGAHRLREPLAADRGLELVEIVALFLPELAVNRPQLLVQVELALVLKDRAFDVVLDLPLEPQQLELGGKKLRDAREELGPCGRLEQALPVLEADEQVRRHGERTLVSGLRFARHREDLSREAPVQRDVFLEQLIGAPHDGVTGRVVARLERERRDRNALMPFGGREPHRPGASHPFDEHLDRSVRQARCLDDSPYHADAEQIRRGWLLHVGASLRDQEDPPLSASRFVNRGERGGAPDEEGDHHVREHDEIAQRQDRQALRNVVRVGVASDEGHEERI